MPDQIPPYCAAGCPFIRWAFAAVVASCLCGQQLATAEWKAGAAAVEITPELPMWMSGYGGRTAPGAEVAHPLYAKALALEDGNGKVAVLVTLDVLGVPAVLRNEIARRAQQQHDLPPEALLLNASHTHCSPELRGVETALSRRDEARQALVARYQARLADQIVEVIGTALAGRTAAEVAFSRATCGFAMNRRQNYALPTGHPRHGKAPNPDGPVDHDVPVLRVMNGHGQLLAVLFGYACHNTTWGDPAFAGDYAGFAQSYLEQAHPGTVAMFMAGCGGDQNPHPRRNMVPGLTGFELAQHHGRTLALAVEAALNAHPESLDDDLRYGLETLPLEYMPAPTRAELEERATSKHAATREYAETLLDWLDQQGSLPTEYPYPVQLFRLGDKLTLVALASETVVDYSLRLKRELADEVVWVAGYSNDFLGYIPSLRVWQEGGYEGGGASTYYGGTLWRVVHPNIWAPSVEERIVKKVQALRKQLDGVKPAP